MYILQNTKPVAERVLSEAWGASVSLDQKEDLRRSTRSQVYRYFVRSDAPNIPESVIVKRSASWDIEADFEALELFLAEDGPFMSYSLRDVSWDNCLLAGAGSNLSTWNSAVTTTH